MDFDRLKGVEETAQRTAANLLAVCTTCRGGRIDRIILQCTRLQSIGTQLSDLRNFFQQRLQLRQLERFDQVVIKARFERATFVFLLSPTGLRNE